MFVPVSQEALMGQTDQSSLATIRFTLSVTGKKISWLADSCSLRRRRRRDGTITVEVDFSTLVSSQLCSSEPRGGTGKTGSGALAGARLTIAWLSLSLPPAACRTQIYRTLALREIGSSLDNSSRIKSVPMICFFFKDLGAFS